MPTAVSNTIVGEMNVQKKGHAWGFFSLSIFTDTSLVAAKTIIDTMWTTKTIDLAVQAMVQTVLDTGNPSASHISIRIVTEMLCLLS